MDYKFGIIVKRNVSANGYGRYGQQRNIGLCACGQHLWVRERPSALGGFECDNCGNRLFVDAINRDKGRFVIPYLEMKRKDNRGFKAVRVNLSIVYDGDSVVPIKENLKRTMEYDIVDKKLKVWRLDELEYDSSDNNMNSIARREKANRMYFTMLPEELFINFVSNEVTRDLYRVAKELGSNGYGYKPDIVKGLEKLMSEEYTWMQILANAGIPNVDRFRNSRYYNRNTAVKPDATKPHEILRVPKFFMAYIREDLTIDYQVLLNLQSHFKNLDQGKFREIMSIVKDEGTMRDLSRNIGDIMNIHIDYEYTNIKKLILYLFREVRLLQGIDDPSDATTYLKDYIRMSRHMGLQWEKYPKSLKKEHDVVQMNYNMINAGKETNDLFKLSVEKKSYKSLVFGVKDKKTKYAILTPNTPEDLVKEGNQLSHCVASYVSDVNSDKCKIVFLRDKEELDKPLATIEVRGLNIRQARGFANRAIPEDQKEFIKQWAEQNNLIEAYY